MHLRRLGRGFTLIELLVVIVIIAVLMAIAIPAYLSQQKKAKDTQAKTSLATAWKSARAELVSNNGSSGYPTPLSLSNLLAADQPQLSFSIGTQAATTSANQIAIDPTSGGKTLILYAKSGGGDIWKLQADPTSSGADATHLTNIGPPPTGYFATAMADSPLLFWRLNDSGASATDAAASYTGSFAGTVTKQVAGATASDAPNNYAATFDGTTGYVSLSSVSAPKPNPPFTVEFWVKGLASDTVGATNGVLLVGKDTIGAGLGFLMTADNGGGNLGISVDGGGFSTTGYNILDGSWHLVDWTVAANGTSWDIYLDGGAYHLAVSRAATDSFNNAGQLNLASTTSIAAGYGSGAFFKGSLDNFAVYPTALSAARITAHYASR